MLPAKSLTIDLRISIVEGFVLIGCKSQSQKKVMCWAGLCNGAVLAPFWIEGSMNQFVYKQLLEEKV